MTWHRLQNGRIGYATGFRNCDGTGGKPCHGLGLLSVRRKTYDNYDCTCEFSLKGRQVGIRYIAHSTYLIQTDEDLQILTDWSGDFSYKIDEVPDVITMNHAHETHWTSNPDPDITHALKGWGSNGKPAEHYLELARA